MANVDPLYAQWLQREADYVVRADAASSARWGATALSTEKLTAIATLAGASIEGDRQLAFLARGPFAIDVHQLVGTDWADAIGTVVTLTGDRLDYDEGVDVFVIAAEVERSTGLSSVTVARPLRTLS